MNNVSTIVVKRRHSLQWGKWINEYNFSAIIYILFIYNMLSESTPSYPIK